MIDDQTNQSDAPVLTPGPNDQPDERARRELLLMRAGAHRVGVFADEADHVSEGLKPTPLPHAPPSVLGVVCVRGRMRTLLDPSALLDAETTTAHVPPTSVPFIVALRGDEQLALAVERVERIIEIFTDALEPVADALDFVRGIVRHEGATVVVLAPEQLFRAAIEPAERRRQRT